MVPPEIVPLLEEATRMRLFVSEAPKLSAVMNQRFEVRSYRTRGEKVGWPFATDAKKTSVSAFSPPSDEPVALSKVRRRPLTPTRNCAGPTAPEVSGG